VGAASNPGGAPHSCVVERDIKKIRKREGKRRYRERERKRERVREGGRDF
jgi:hypothetical protein